MKLWREIQGGVCCCALLVGIAPAVFAQAKVSSLDSILAEIEVSYDSAMWVVHAGERSAPILAIQIRQQRTVLDSLTRPKPHADASEQDERMERRWNTVQRLLMQNLDSLATRVDSPAFTSADLNPLPDSARVAGRDTFPLVSSITGRVLRQLNPVLGAAGAQSMSQARFVAVSQLFDAFRLYRERLLTLLEEACRERVQLCLDVDPTRNRPYGGVTISGYAGALYGVGGFVSISKFTGAHGKIVKGRRAVIGAQVLANLWNKREWAVEISGGSVFGDFVAMPGVIFSWQRDRAVELSGSVLYLPRGRLSLGVSYAVDHGLGVRAVYGIRPRSRQSR
jgi:hypothetical protein